MDITHDNVCSSMLSCFYSYVAAINWGPISSYLCLWGGGVRGCVSGYMCVLLYSNIEGSICVTCVSLFFYVLDN